MSEKLVQVKMPISDKLSIMIIRVLNFQVEILELWSPGKTLSAEWTASCWQTPHTSLLLAVSLRSDQFPGSWLWSDPSERSATVECSDLLLQFGVWPDHSQARNMIEIIWVKLSIKYFSMKTKTICKVSLVLSRVGCSPHDSNTSSLLYYQ